MQNTPEYSEFLKMKPKKALGSLKRPSEMHNWQIITVHPKQNEVTTEAFVVFFQ